MPDINRGTAGVLLPPAASAEIWQGVQEQSVVQQLVPQTPLPGSGIAVSVITGDPVAQFVGETQEKPVSRATLGNRVMRPYTVSLIEPFANQFRRDLGGLYNALVSRLPGSLAKAFDIAVLHGDGAPVGDFDTLAGSPAVTLAAGSVYSGLLSALGTVSTADDADANAIAASPQLEQMLLGELDGNGRPLFAPSADAPGGRIGSVLGRTVVKNKAVLRRTAGPDTLGVIGDWTMARWGQVDAISVAITDQATLNDGGQLLHLFQRNMFAVRVEVEFGFVARTDDAFARLNVA